MKQIQEKIITSKHLKLKNFETGAMNMGSTIMLYVKPISEFHLISAIFLEIQH